LTPDTARIQAKRLLGLVASGEDPAQRKSADRRATTVAELCDLYLAEGVAHKKARHKRIAVCFPRSNFAGASAAV
jgi:hypothetical protein